jgi:hypothetical protein
MSFKDIIFLIVGFAAGAACVGFWPETYTKEQCVLDKMRGQQQGMFFTAVNACDRYPNAERTPQ